MEASDVEAWLAGRAGEDHCQVTTRGRRTGREHTVEIWFATAGGTVYLLSGRRADWVRNALADPAVGMRIGEGSRAGRAREVTDPEEEQRARRMLAAKYRGSLPGQELSSWAATAFPVAIDLEGGPRRA